MRLILLTVLAIFYLSACDGTADAVAEKPEMGAEADIADEPDPISNSEPEKPGSGLDIDSLPGFDFLSQPWTGDLDGMVERRVVRVLTVYGEPRYFLEGPEQKGIVYETFKQFEKILNEKVQSGHLRVHVVIIPVTRDQLIPKLVEGRGDIAVASLTITPERQQLVAFSDPVSRQINEVLVTGPAAPEVQTLDDLAGQTVHVRESSSYFASLQELSQTLTDAGKPAIDIQPLSELLEDADVLEMVHSGLLPWAVVDDFEAQMWASVFDQLTIHSDLVLRSGGFIGYAFRQDSPQLAAKLNTFIKTHRQGTLFGNTMINRYIRDYNFVENALNPDEYAKFKRVQEIFKTYGEQYGIDYLLVAAQGYQESRLDQNVRSPAGAIGVMQLLPTTAADPNVGIPDIHIEEKNIHAGIKYLSFIRDRYFDDPDIDPLNQALMAFAAYNAGPARVNRMRKTAADQGLDPNVWFNNVEVIAAKEIGRETVQYVSNIFKYYTTYLMSSEQELQREAARQRTGLD